MPFPPLPPGVAPEPFARARHAAAALLLGAAALLGGCKPAPVEAPATPASSAAASAASALPGAAGAAASAPPVSVTTVPVARRKLPLRLESSGTVVPVMTVDVRPQVTSVVRSVLVKEGQFVRAGEPLFTLDAAADEANVARLKAQLARDEAALADAERQYARSRELQAQNFVAQGAVDTARTLVQTQAATVAASRAALDAARVPLGYARIQAPSAGRVGAINVYPGSSVQANATTLVTITQLDPVDVAFTVPQRHLADALAALRGSGTVVEAALPEGGAALGGRLVFVDNAIDAASGTVKVKAWLPNPANRLWPGAFVRVTFTVRTLENALVIPQAAIVQSARGPIVYVVEDGRAALRPLRVLATEGEDAAVEGLQSGDRVVLDGRQNLRPGSRVLREGLR
ncbi:MAG: RND transporter [Rubrivivax sp.]